MLGKENLSSKINRLCDELPDCCTGFIMQTGTELANTTRLEYAKELGYFFDYLSNYIERFAEKEKKSYVVADLATVTSEEISQYLTIYKNQGKSERTLARKRSAISSYFSYMVKNRRLEFNPVGAASKVKIPQSDEVIHLNVNEQITFLNAVEYGTNLTKKQQKLHERYRLRDMTLMTLLLDTGMRVSELHGIDIADLDLEQCSVIVTRKGNKIQTIYYSDSTRDIIIEYLASKGIAPEEVLGHRTALFTTNKGDRLSVRAIEDLVKKYAESNIPGKGTKISPHKLRSSYAMLYYKQSGNDILSLKRNLGHSDISTTQIYARASQTDAQDSRNIVDSARSAASNSRRPGSICKSKGAEK